MKKEEMEEIKKEFADLRGQILLFERDQEEKLSFKDIILVWISIMVTLFVENVIAPHLFSINEPLQALAGWIFTAVLTFLLIVGLWISIYKFHKKKN